MEELKSCPFCGGESYHCADVVEYLNYDKQYVIFCQNCSCHSPTTGTEEQAIEAWNKRST